MSDNAEPEVQSSVMEIGLGELARLLGVPGGMTILSVRLIGDTASIVITPAGRPSAVLRRNGQPRELSCGTMKKYLAGCHCKKCTAVNARKRDRQAARANAATLESAVNHYKQWTGPEMEIAARADLTARQAALMIGRSMKAVKTMRMRLRNDPKYRNAAGVS